MKRLLQLAAVFVATCAASSTSALASNQYAHDDGVPNSGLSYGIATDYCWFHSFTTFGSADSITNVQVMWEPSSIPAGTPVTVCVWEDPNDDGNPSDAILVSQQASLVPNVATYTYTTYPVAPALVHNRFFVGAFVTTDGNFGTISLLDFNTPLTHIAYFATDAPGFFNPALLSTSSYNHIETLGTQFHGVFMLRAAGADTPPVTYCTAKPNSAGCTPQMGFFGTPSASAAAGFHVYATGVVNRAPGLLIYGTSGRATIPFGGGWLCFNSPIRRTQVQSSGGNAVGVDCSGSYHIDFGAWIATGMDPSLVAGTTVEAQYYSRDNGFAVPNNIGLTNALEFTLVP